MILCIYSVLCVGFSMHFVQSLVCVMCRLQSLLCGGFSQCYVWDSVCVMCGLYTVLCAGFSLCYVQSSVCPMSSLLCLWLAAEAARVALMIHVHTCIYIYICMQTCKQGGADG